MDIRTDTCLIGGRYELVQRLGAGGMAEVYLATDTRLGRNVAVKLLAALYAADPAALARFEREARAAAAVSNPHVVSVLDAGVADGRAFLVMEYVPGPTLRDVLLRRGPLPETEALSLAAEVADGLAAAHRSGIVHGDVKPANVLLDAEGRAKLADFGIARLASAAATPGATSVMGTAHYLSPEQAEGRPIDGRADVYSLGVLLFELLTGRPPFQGDSVVAVPVQHLERTPPSPRTLRAELSAAAEAVVLRALAKNPADRFASAVEMRDALAAARGQGATVPLRTVPLPRSAPELAAARLRSHPAPRFRRDRLIPLLGLSVLLLIGAVVALARGGRATETASSAPIATEVVATQPAPLVTVPDLSGASQERAAASLSSAGLRLGAVARAPSRVVSAGQVSDQDPGAGAAVPGGTDVAITLSSGPPTPTTTSAPAPALQLPPGHAKRGKGHGGH
jgi:serine/threonine-protein kinase